MCVSQGSCERLERFGCFVTGSSSCRQNHLARLLFGFPSQSEARNILYAGNCIEWRRSSPAACELGGGSHTLRDKKKLNQRVFLGVAG